MKKDEVEDTAEQAVEEAGDKSSINKTEPPVEVEEVTTKADGDGEPETEVITPETPAETPEEVVAATTEEGVVPEVKAEEVTEKAKKVLTAEEDEDEAEEAKAKKSDEVVTPEAVEKEVVKSDAELLEETKVMMKTIATEVINEIVAPLIAQLTKSISEVK